MQSINVDAIRKLRVENNVSQKELGDMLGISDRAVSKWERGESQPSAKNMIALSKIFNVPIEWFLKKSQDVNEEVCNKTMESIKELYKVGRGPSSSHTIGPERACIKFTEKYKTAKRFKAVLYGSLAKTGRGHGTDVVIKKTFYPKECVVEFNPIEQRLPHPNTMDLTAYDDSGSVLGSSRVLSVGGGSIVMDGQGDSEKCSPYRERTFAQIAKYCKEKDLRLFEYVVLKEGEEIRDYALKVWQEMKNSVKSGLNKTGELPGGLGVIRKAKSLLNNEHVDETPQTKENRIVCAYAFAVGEENACGEKIVTAPTCGAAGVLPAVMLYEQQKNKFSDKKVAEALLTAGLIGNLIKTNASISGAECGCQAEIGSACAMAAAGLAELFGLSIDKIEYAAEIAIEHHLGLTCDPICGLVQIPCIERNAVAAMRAINAVNLASFLWDTRKISFDRVVEAMKETGRDLLPPYKETAEGGLAKIKL